MVMFLVSLPVRTATSCSCAVRLAATHALAKAGDSTILVTWVFTKLCRLDSIGAGQRPQGRRDHRKPLRRKGIGGLVRDRLDVDPGEDLLGDPVDDGRLDRRVAGERRDRRDVPVGVADLVARPAGHDRRGRTQSGDHDEECGDGGAPPSGAHPRAGAGAAARQPAPFGLQLLLELLDPKSQGLDLDLAEVGGVGHGPAQRQPRRRQARPGPASHGRRVSNRRVCDGRVVDRPVLGRVVLRCRARPGSRAGLRAGLTGWSSAGLAVWVSAWARARCLGRALGLWLVRRSGAGCWSGLGSFAGSRAAPAGRFLGGVGISRGADAGGAAACRRSRRTWGSLATSTISMPSSSSWFRTPCSAD